MNKNSDEIDQEFLGRLEKQYKSGSVEEPSVDLDKQIIAAAHREIAEPNKLKRPNNSWWRRLSLPVTAAATFAFTAIATHLLLPEKVGVPPGTASPRPIQIDLVDEKDLKLKVEQRKPRKAPKFESPIKEPEVSSKVENDDIADMHNEMKVENGSLRTKVPELNQAKEKNKSLESSKGAEVSKLAKLEHPEKEKWSRQIIELFKKGEFEKAQKELVRFKKIYPDYPIDAQIEALKSM